MSEDSDGAEKTHEPTPKKLEDARKRGEIPKSTDLTTAASYLGFIMATAILGSGSIGALASMNAQLLSRADEISAQVFAGGGVIFTAALLPTIAKSVLPLFGLPALAVLISLVAQRAVHFAPEKITPKLNKISPLSGLKNKLGAKGLFEFAKSAVKLCLISTLLTWFAIGKMELLMGTLLMTPAQMATQISALLIEFLTLVLIMWLIIGAIDYLWQSAEHIRKNMMSRKELQDEMKQSEGDPHFKQARRQRGYDIAMNKMLAEVPKADVIVVNPTHYAIALQWDRISGRAPICLAKGVDEIAARIREVAMDSDIPIHSDPPTARALHATLEVGDEVKPDQYKAVAAAIRFAEKIRGEARKSAK